MATVNMIKKFSVIVVAIVLLSFSSLSTAEDLRFYIIAKNKADTNFQRVYQGCQDLAQKSGDQCILAGPEVKAQAREQLEAIEAILTSQQVDGMAISVIDSALVRSALKNTLKHVITFDSPLIPQTPEQKIPFHIGVDDEKIGRKLAKIAMADKPQGGTVCIFTDNDPNLARRVQGIRLQLSNEASSKKLQGENGWHESARCPWVTGDNALRVKNQMKYTLEVIKPDVILSTGHWPAYFPEVTMWVTENHLADLKSGKPYLYSAIGFKLPSFKALEEVGYVHGFVEIDFYEQGRLLYQTLRNYSEGRSDIDPMPKFQGSVIHHHIQH